MFDCEKEELLLFSGENRKEVEQLCLRVRDLLAGHPDVPLSELAYSLNVNRPAGSLKRFFIAKSGAELMSLIDEADFSDEEYYYQKEKNRQVSFMFPGGGAQHVGMAQDLFRKEPMFRKFAGECTDILKDVLDADISHLLFPPDEQWVAKGELTLQQFAYSLSGLFVIEYALARLLMYWGIKPVSMIGHSLGEYVAACISGVFSLQDALQIVVMRGRLFDTMPEGRMISVNCDRVTLNRALPPQVSVAAVNGPEMFVLSCAYTRCADLEHALTEAGIAYKYLNINIAAHSAEVESILPQFKACLTDIRFNAPSIPFASNLTGTWITPDQAVNSRYWAMHLRDTVQFSYGVEVILRQRNTAIVEAGPGRGLSTVCQVHPWKDPDTLIVNAMPNLKQSITDEYQLLSTVGRLWESGIDIDFRKLNPAPAKQVFSL